MDLRRNPNREYQQLFEAAKQARLPFEREAWLNLAFYLDEQYVEWNDDANTVRRIPRRTKREENMPRPVVNKIMHYVRQAHAEVLQDKPVGDVLPPTDDYADISAALVARHYIEYASSPVVTNYDRQLARSALWALIAGTGWKKWVWDAGEDRLDVIPTSFFDLYLDPYAREFSRARWAIHSQFMDPEQVYELWGVDPDKLRGDVSQIDPTKADLLRGIGAAPVLSGVTVNEMWMKPSRRHPQGLYVVWAGRQTLVEPQPHPYAHKRLPFTQLGCIERPDSPYFMSPIKYLRSPQMLLNKYWAQRIMVGERFANPKWWIPTEIDLDEDPDDSPSQVLRGSSGGMGLKPELLMPTTFARLDDGEMIETQMMHVVGQREVSQAQVPGRVEAAKAIELLKEADANALSTLRDTMQVANSEGWYQALQLARQYEREEIMVQAYSREGVPEVKRFRKDALKPGLRVRTTMTSGLSRSRANRQDLLLRMWELKIIQDPELVAELMEVPVPMLLSTRAADIRLARNENLDLGRGTAVDANSWDDHAIHLREHNAYRKTQEFHELDDETKQKFEFHCQRHEQLQEVVIQKQARLQMMAQGQMAAPTEGGGNPPAGDPATQQPQEGSVTQP